MQQTQFLFLSWRVHQKNNTWDIESPWTCLYATILDITFIRYYFVSKFVICAALI